MDDGLIWCPRCYGRGQEPIYGPHFDHDGDNMPSGWVTCTYCQGKKRVEPRR